MAFKPLPKADLDHILTHTEPLWRELRGAGLFITGGTGFFGKWMLETIVAANDNLDAGVKATVLSRDPARFANDMPHLANRGEFKWIRGDVTDFVFPAGEFSHVVHLAKVDVVHHCRWHTARTRLRQPARRAASAAGKLGRRVWPAA
jgi:dTDP-glucose 4,6-dehydratase